jgi:hypothetical protein
MFNPSERIFSRWQQAKQLSALAGDSKGPSGQLTETQPQSFSDPTS